VKIAVLSDSHDNIAKLDDALPTLCSADAVIHCGDLCSPFMIHRLGSGVGEIPVHIVWGNNEGDPWAIAKAADEYPHVILHGALAELDLGGLRVAVNHYPRIARGLAKSGDYDLVCYGHDHTAHEEWIDECLLLNPGELMGLKGRSTLAVVDTVDRKVRWVEL
jgi:putative phosphoesterase